MATDMGLANLPTLLSVVSGAALLTIMSREGRRHRRGNRGPPRVDSLDGGQHVHGDDPRGERCDSPGPTFRKD